MGERKRASPQQQDTIDTERRAGQREARLLSEQLHTRDLGALSLTETPFVPQMDEHAALLASAGSDEARRDLVLNLQRTYGNRYVQRLIQQVERSGPAGTAQDSREPRQEADRTVLRPTVSGQTRVLQRGFGSAMIQRRIVIGGKPYTPTKKYYAYLVGKFGPHMGEFIKRMHNAGNPPDYTFSSYEQMGYEVRIRHQAVKGIEKVHQGCCSYQDTAHPDGYLDPAYWDRVGWMDFKPKSPLPSGKEASDAIEAIFASGAGTQLECLSMTIAIEYYSLLKGLGRGKFNAQFPGGAGIEISASPSHQTLLSGATQKSKKVIVSSASELLPGDWVYFKNFKDYPVKNPGGFWQGENAIYLGNGKYRGFGVPSLSETAMNAELVSKYNGELGEHKTVANLIADGGGLQMDPVVRPEIAKAVP